MEIEVLVEDVLVDCDVLELVDDVLIELEVLEVEVDREVDVELVLIDVEELVLDVEVVLAPIPSFQSRNTLPSPPKPPAPL